MSTKETIDLSQLPPPDVIKPVDYEATLAEMKADILQACPQAASVLALESSTLVKFLERCAYWHMNRAQIENEDAHAVMLAYARGSDLEQLGAFYGVARLIITPEDTSTTPPTPAVMESDEALRTRIQLAPKGFSTAGPIDAYVFHSLSADGRILHVYAHSPTPGQVLVTLLSHEGNGAASDELIKIVEAALNDENTRPVTDFVRVQSAEIVNYAITANIHTLTGPDTELVMQEVQKSIDAYTQQTRGIGASIPLSGIYAALHLAGVERVELIEPTTEITLTSYQAAYCTSITLNQVKV